MAVTGAGSTAKICFHSFFMSTTVQPLRLGFVESFVKLADGRLAVVGPLALGVGVVHDTGINAGRCRQSVHCEHLQVAIGVSEGGDGAAADVLMDADRLAFLVVNEVQLRQAHEHRLAVAHFELRLDAAADDLLGRDAIDLLRPRAHELDAAAGDDEGLESVRPQVGEQFEHRLIDHLRVSPLPVTGCLAVAIQSFTIFSNSSVVMPAWVAMTISIIAFSPPASAALTSPLSSEAKGSLSFHSGCCGASAFTRSKAKMELEIHRLFGPERAVVVERGDALGRRHEVGRIVLRDLCHEFEDRRLGRPVIPRGERIGLGVCRNDSKPRGTDGGHKKATADSLVVHADSSSWCVFKAKRLGSRCVSGTAVQPPVPNATGGLAPFRSRPTILALKTR